MNRLRKGMAACGLLVLGHCGLTLLAATLHAAWITAVPLLALWRSGGG